MRSTDPTLRRLVQLHMLGVGSVEAGTKLAGGLLSAGDGGRDDAVQQAEPGGGDGLNLVWGFAFSTSRPEPSLGARC